MKYLALVTLASFVNIVHAEFGQSADTAENRRVQEGVYDQEPSASANAHRHGDLYLVPTPAECSNAGDQTARPVYHEVNGEMQLAGFECVQDNRGN